MRQLESSQDNPSNESRRDPYHEVMGDDRPGRVRLLGAGASRKKLNDKRTSTSLILPKEVMESIKTAVTADVQKDLNAEKEELAREKEAHATQVANMERVSKELELEATKLQEMRKEFEAQRDTMSTLDVIASALSQLRQKDPSLTPELIAKVIVSTATNGAT